MSGSEVGAVEQDAGMADEPDPHVVIGRALPDLRIESVERLGEGWDHVAFLVNGDLVFRLPWEPGEIDARPEIALLRAVAGRVPVAVPEPLHVDPGHEWFGYRFLPGPAIADGLEAWSSPARQSVLAELVVDVMLAVEAAVSIDDAERLDLDVRTDDGRRLVTQHADLGLDHWLLDERGTPYALIDWSDACVASVEQQLSTLAWDLPDLVDLAAAAYERRTGHVVDRGHAGALAVANATDDLEELLAQGLAPDDREILRCRAVIDRWSGR